MKELSMTLQKNLLVKGKLHGGYEKTLNFKNSQETKSVYKFFCGGKEVVFFAVKQKGRAKQNSARS